MNSSMYGDFQICISVPLSTTFGDNIAHAVLMNILYLSKLNTVLILCLPSKRSKTKGFWLSILSDSLLFKPFPSK